MSRKNTPRIENHMRAIRPLGGAAALAQRSDEDRHEIAQIGGKARAEQLSSRQRSAIARKAALARWALKRQVT